MSATRGAQVSDKRLSSRRQGKHVPSCSFQQFAEASHGVACRCTRHAARKPSDTSGSLVHVAPVAAHAPGLDDPARHRRNGEVADDGRVGRGHYCPFPL